MLRSLPIADKAIPYLEEVFKHYDTMGKLKVSEKSNFKSSCSLLSYSYGKKKDNAKLHFTIRNMTKRIKPK